MKILKNSAHVEGGGSVDLERREVGDVVAVWCPEPSNVKSGNEARVFISQEHHADMSNMQAECAFEAPEGLLHVQTDLHGTKR